MSNLTEKFIKLREFIFNRNLRSYAHEREWESEECAELREEQNKALKAIFDYQTAQIIRGVEYYELTPTCGHDLYKEREQIKAILDLGFRQVPGEALYMCYVHDNGYSIDFVSYDNPFNKFSLYKNKELIKQFSEPYEILELFGE